MPRYLEHLINSLVCLPVTAVEVLTHLRKMYEVSRKLSELSTVTASTNIAMVCRTALIADHHD